MRRALVIGSPALGLDVSLALERMSDLLENRLEFDDVETRTDDDATRDEILPALERWVSSTESDDDCLFYYFGHAGQLRFTDLSSPVSRQRFGFVTTTPQYRGEEYGSILDVELAEPLTRLDLRCRNVTVLLDCCHSGDLVRSGSSFELIRETPLPDWAREGLSKVEERLSNLAIDSHPRIARLAAASPMREAYSFAEERGGRVLGHMTQAFVDVVEAAGPRWREMTWEVLTHAVRERVIAALGMESQWVSFTGPRARKLFSRAEGELRRLIGFVADVQDPKVGWLRAGALSGVRMGDRWSVRAPAEETQTTAEVVGVELNRARLALVDASEFLDGSCCAEIVRATEPNLFESVGFDEELEIIEARGRAARLLSSSASMLTPDYSSPLRWSWGLFTPDGDPVGPPCPTEIPWDHRLWIRVEHLGEPPLPWFASAVLIDNVGRPHLVNARAPEGFELIPGGCEIVGMRFGCRHQGLPLPRLPRLPPPCSPERAILLLLACRRPIELAHLVDAQPMDPTEALAMQGLNVEPENDRDRAGPRPPDLATSWAMRRVDVWITPRRVEESGR